MKLASPTRAGENGDEFFRDLDDRRKFGCLLFWRITLDDFCIKYLQYSREFHLRGNMADCLYNCKVRKVPSFLLGVCREKSSLQKMQPVIGTLVWNQAKFPAR